MKERRICEGMEITIICALSMPDKESVRVTESGMVKMPLDLVCINRSISAVPFGPYKVTSFPTEFKYQAIKLPHLPHPITVIFKNDTRFPSLAAHDLY